MPSENSGALASDVVATKLAFTLQPLGSVSAQVLSVQPVVEAHDDLDVRDQDFGEPVKLTTTAPGTLANNTVIFSNGIGDSFQSGLVKRSLRNGITCC